jgi:hypothetical protein
MTKQHARLPLRSRENGSGAIGSAGRKRPRGRRNASGASRQSQRPKQRLKKRSVTMKKRSKKSTETAPHSTDGRKRRTRAGKSRRRNWKPLCAGRATSDVAMSQDARRVDPSAVRGGRPAPFPGFIEPCRPALRKSNVVNRKRCGCEVVYAANTFGWRGNDTGAAHLPPVASGVPFVPELWLHWHPKKSSTLVGCSFSGLILASQ